MIPKAMTDMDVLTVKQTRRIDEIAIQEFGMNSLVLMENAGRGCAEFIHHLVLNHFGNAGTIVTILCGPGNNGGDGLVIARHLYATGHSVKLWMIAESGKLSHDARCNLNILQHTHLPVEWIEPSRAESSALDSPPWTSLRSDCDLSGIIVDALLGTGATGAPRSAMAEAIRIANASSARRIAIDVPTGLNAENGEPSVSTFQAQDTLTFVAWKPGFLMDHAKRWLGNVHVLPIGIPPEVRSRI